MGENHSRAMQQLKVEGVKTIQCEIVLGGVQTFDDDILESL